jgi:hypothetical protein
VRLVLALGVVLVTALSISGPADGDPNAYRAAVAFWAMKHEFLDTRSGVYREATNTTQPAHAWPYSQALSATIEMTTVPHRGRLYLEEARRRLHGLRLYLRHDGAYRAAEGSADVYYDDNEWIALELMHWWNLHHERWALARSARVFEIVRRAWDPDATHPCPGGIFWTNAAGNDDRNTVTTATGALLAMRLYEATHNRYYVRWARRMLDWVEACMGGPDGLLWDHVGKGGVLDQTHWSYNQGTAIGANVLLYRLTNDGGALARARQLADASLAYFDRTPGGREPPYFLAIFFRNLLDLAAVDHNPAYRAAAQAYADAAWARSRLAGTDVFRFDSGGPSLLEQAAMVQIYAALTAAR